MAASKCYVEALTKLAKHAQQGTWNGSADIGSAVLQLIEVQKEMEAQQSLILKAFYVDLLVPLESNIEKDAKIVAAEQKRFLHQHKQQYEAFQKISAMVKKQRKKSKSGANIEKQFKIMQQHEEEKRRLDALCDESLKQAITQERRRYGFVLERQCSLAKHQIAYFAKGQSLIQGNIENWLDVVNTREELPEAILKQLQTPREIRLSHSDYNFDTIDSITSAGSRYSTTSAIMRRSRSNDVSCVDLRSLTEQQDLELDFPPSLARAQSDFNLASSSNSLVSSNCNDYNDNISVTRKTNGENGTNGSSEKRVRAVYTYQASAENQLSFHEGDVITLLGERYKGWNFGENLKTRKQGWFPIAYTEPDTGYNTRTRPRSGSDASSANTPAQSSCSSDSSGGTAGVVPGVLTDFDRDTDELPPFPSIQRRLPTLHRRPLSSFFENSLLNTCYTEAIVHRSADDFEGGRRRVKRDDDYSPTASPSASAARNLGAAQTAKTSGSSTRHRGGIESPCDSPTVSLRSSGVTTVSQGPPTRSMTSPGPLVVTPLPPLRSLAILSSASSDRDSAYSSSTSSSAGSANNDSISTTSSQQTVTPTPPQALDDEIINSSSGDCSVAADDACVVKSDIANRFNMRRSLSKEKSSSTDNPA